MDTELELAIFGIISSAGEAKSTYLSAISLAKNGDISGARARILEGAKAKQLAQESHLNLVQKEAQAMQEKNDSFRLSLLLVHAEDQMMSAETVEIMAKEMIDLYEKLGK